MSATARAGGAKDFAEARRLAELGRDSGYGSAPDTAIQRHRDARNLLGTYDPTPLYADTLRWEGTVLRDRGRTSEAEPLYERSLQIARRIGYESGVAHALNCLAGLAQRRGDVANAARLLADAHLLADRCGERRLVAMIQTNLAIIADVRGDVETAIDHFHIALDVAIMAEDEQQVERILLNFGSLLVAQRRFDEAERVLTRGIGIAKARGDLYYEGVFEENRAEMRLSRGEVDDAQPSIARALEIAEQRRDDLRKAAALKLRGAYERMSARPEAAADSLRYALTLAAVGEDALMGAEIMYQFGMALYDGNDTSMAQEAWRTAIDAFDRIAANEWSERARARLRDGSTGRYL